MAESGFSVVTASRLEPLADRLADALRAAPLAPLDRETILVARKAGLQAWTRQALARRLGVAASLDLRSPRDLTAALARRLVPEGAPDESVRARPFEAAALAWRLRDVLADLPPGPLYDRVRVYLGRAAARGDGPLPLAARLAALYDEYQVYRPDLLAAWAEGHRPLGGWPDEPWQADLWRRLLDGAHGMDRATHLTALIARLDALPDREALHAALGPAASPLWRVHVVGALGVPPLYGRVLAALARLVPVTHYAVAHGLPADPYGDAFREDGFAHPLLREWAGPTHASISVLRDVGRPAVTRLPEGLGDPACALHALQAALSADVPPEAPTPCAASDRSVRILDCHSPLRELEVLRDELLDAFATLPGLRPEDVAILVPDLALYAPLVDAVFGESGEAGARLPVHVADHPFAPELRVLDAFHRVLALDAGRATASDVVGLLDVPAVRRAAGIREDELGALMDWVRAARVHWGRDRAHKAQFGLPDDDVHTWRFGLDRLLLGVAVGPDAGGVAGGALVLDRLPVAEATLDGADLLGRFAEWTTALFGRLAALRAPREPAQWADDLVTFVDDVFLPRTGAELDALVALRTALDGLATLPDGAPLAASDVRHHLAASLAAPDRHEPYLTGKITVADLLALRHAPFRVVAVVGLGDAFPRARPRPDFDAMGAAPLAGDPDGAAEDRQTFLDAVMAAGDRLLLSYVGRSHHDNHERAPSAVLDALLDAARRAFGVEAAERLVVRHALQPFSPAYFRPEPASTAPTHFTYAASHAPPAQVLGRRDGLRFFDAPPPDLEGGEPADPDEAYATTTEALARAWINPSRAHCAALQVDLRLTDDALEDDEPVVLDGLAFHGVKADVLAGLLAGEDEDAVVARLVRSGRLPPGALAEVYLSRAFGSVREIAERVRAHGATTAVALDVSHGPWRVEATVEASPDAGALRFRPGRVGPKDLVRGWVDHLALCASDADVPRRTLVVGDGAASAFAEVPQAEARAVLQFLVRGAELFKSVPPPLFERASHAQAAAQRATWRRTHEQIVALESAGWKPLRVGRAVASDAPTVDAPFIQGDARKLFDGRYEDRPDMRDPAVALCYRRRAPLRDMAGAFDRWARMLWGPLLAHRDDA